MINKKHDAVLSFIISKIVDLTSLPRYELNELSSFSDIGLTSKKGVMLIVALSNWLEIEIEPTCLFECETIGELTSHVVGFANQSSE